MNAQDPTRLPFEEIIEIQLDLLMARDECVNAARALMANAQLDERALEKCARLDDALAKAHRTLEFALRSACFASGSRELPHD